MLYFLYSQCLVFEVIIRVRVSFRMNANRSWFGEHFINFNGFSSSISCFHLFSAWFADIGPTNFQ